MGLLDTLTNLFSTLGLAPPSSLLLELSEYARGCEPPLPDGVQSDEQATWNLLNRWLANHPDEGESQALLQEALARLAQQRSQQERAASGQAELSTSKLENQASVYEDSPLSHI